MLFSLILTFFMTLCGTMSNLLTKQVTKTSDLADFWRLLTTSDFADRFEVVSFASTLNSIFKFSQIVTNCTINNVTTLDKAIRQLQDFADILFYINWYYLDIVYLIEPIVWLVIFFIVFMFFCSCISIDLFSISEKRPVL